MVHPPHPRLVVLPDPSEVGARGPGRGLPLWLVYPIFFLSGFAAILYQIVWQRALFTIYGTSVESVTIVVTAFMLGLGFGSLAGIAAAIALLIPGMLPEKSRER